MLARTPTAAMCRKTVRSTGIDLSSLAAALPTAPIKLRDYQVTAVERVLEALDSGISRPAVVLATGGGKTMVISHLIPRIKGETPKRTKTLVLAHKEELIRQAAKTIRDVNPDMQVDIDMQKLTPSENADVIVGSVPTLVRMSRLTKYNPDEFKAIILDECHHATASSWTKILGYFNALEDSKIPVLGFTATFERSDGIALASVFQKVVYERNIFQMVAKGELCDARFSVMKVDLDLDDVKVSKGDYMPSKLSEAMNKENINLQVTLAYIKLQKEHSLKSTLVFCVDVEHCRTLCGVLQANGVNAQYVTGNTVKHERKAILDDFKAGKIQVLCNVLVFTEGTDIPNIDSLILARPTKSRPLLTQMIGRGLRLHKGKDYCHIIDLAGSMKLGVSSVPLLFGLQDGHAFTKKTFKDLDKEKEELSEAQKQEAANARALHVDKMLQLQNEIASQDVVFESVDGFASMFNNAGIANTDTDDTLTLFREDFHDWVRLEYNLWGLQLNYNNVYCTIERSNDGSFILHLVRKVSSIERASRHYKMERTRKDLISSGSLTSVLAIADSIYKRETGFKPFKFAKKQVTGPQINWIMKLLQNKVTNLYGPESVAILKDKLSEIPMSRASSLIFAATYSVNCLWVQWELNKFLGPTKQQQAYKARLEKKLQKLQLLKPEPVTLSSLE